MARRPKPWYRKDRRLWCVTLDGQRYNLGPDKKAAFEKFHQLLAQPAKRHAPSGGVVEIIDAFLDWCQKHRAADTYEWYRYRLQRFAEKYPSLLAGDLRPFDVQQWLDEMTELSSGSRRNHCRAIKRCMRWAEQQGLIEKSPIAHMEQPKAGKREQVVSELEFERILSLVPDREFRDLLITTWETGCRPQESLRVEARHVDVGNRRWVFPQTEGKGGFLRVVYLTDQAFEITQRLLSAHPQGRLFRNSNGVPWTTDAVNCAFIRLQIRLGKQELAEKDIEIDNQELRKFASTLTPTRTAKGQAIQKSEKELHQEARRKLTNRLACQHGVKYSLYALRHTWATRALQQGVDALTVAVLMGHQDPSTLAKVYQHLTHNPAYLLEQAKKAAG